MQAAKADRGWLWVLVQMPLLACAIAVPVVLRLLHYGPLWPDKFLWPARVAGLATLIGAIALFSASKRALGPFLVPYPAPVEGSFLRREGVYGHMRHPMYLAIMIGTVAWATMWTSIPGIVLAAICIMFFVAKSRYEEQLLLSTFPDYAIYSVSVTAFLPRMRLPRGRVP